MLRRRKRSVWGVSALLLAPQLPFQPLNRFVNSGRVVRLFLGGKHVQILVICGERLVLLPHLLVDLAQPQVGRRVIMILPGRLLVTAERSTIVLPAEIEVANLNALVGRIRREVERLLLMPVIGSYSLRKERSGHARKSQRAEKQCCQDVPHAQIFHPRLRRVNRWMSIATTSAGQFRTWRFPLAATVDDSRSSVGKVE